MGRRLKLFFAHFSVNQLSIYGAVSDMCEECNTCHDRTGRPVVAGQSNPLFVPRQTRQTYLWMMILHKKKIYCKDIRNELESYHNKTGWLKFVLMQDSSLHLKSDSVSWQFTDSVACREYTLPRDEPALEVTTCSSEPKVGFVKIKCTCFLQADPRPKQNHKDVFLPAHRQELYPYGWVTCSRSVGHGDQGITFNQQHCPAQP